MELDTNLIKKIVEKEAQSIIQLVGKKLKEFQFRSFEELKIVYLDYLSRSLKKNANIKTLLYRSEPKFLYNFYEHLDITSGKKSISTEDSDNLFKETNHLILSGTGGIGKSMMMKHLLIDQCYKQSSIPIFFELKELNDFSEINQNLEYYLLENVRSFGLSFTKEEFEYTLDKGRYTILLDGFDEVSSEFNQHISNMIKRFSDRFHTNNIVVSSRPSDRFIGWDSFTEYKIKPLSKQQACSLIKKIDFDKNVTKKFLIQLRKTLYEENKSFASIPLLLNMMLLNFEMNGAIPNNLTEFYSQAFYTLYQRHDASKSGYKRQMKCKVSAEGFKNILGYVGMKTFFQQKIEFSQEDIVKYVNDFSERERNSDIIATDFIFDAVHSVCLFVEEGTNIKFAHRSFQEFFAAFYVQKLDDEVQSKLLLSWSQSENSLLYFNRNFMNALFHLQKDRTIRNLVIPIFNLVEQSMNSLSKDDFIESYFSTFDFDIATDSRVKVSFVLSNIGSIFMQIYFYLFEIIGIDPIDDIDSRDNENQILVSQLLNSLFELENGQSFYEVDSSFILNHSSESKAALYSYLNTWFYPRIDYIIDWKNKYQSYNPAKRKRTLNSIVESL